MRGVAVIVVSQLGSGVQEAALSWEIAGDGGRVSRRLLALASPGEGVELGIADVGESGRGPGVIAGLRSARRGERTWGNRSSAASCRSRATSTAADGRRSTWSSCRRAVVGVVHGGAGRRAAFVVGGGSHVVITVGGVLDKSREDTNNSWLCHQKVFALNEPKPHSIIFTQHLEGHVHLNFSFHPFLRHNNASAGWWKNML